MDGTTGTEVHLNAVAPRYLYHWTKYSALADMARGKKLGDQLSNFRHGVKHSAISIYWPSLIQSEKGALFTWKHPVAGIKGGRDENYGPALLKLEIDVLRARTVRLVEKWNQQKGPSESPFPGLDLSQFDIIFRDSAGDGTKEILVLNPEIILGFTADPALLKIELERELKNLKDSKFEYLREEIHFDGFRKRLLP